MKLTGIIGTGSGKLGSSVFSVSGGQQIVRQYQPVVSNPSTAGQVKNRSKLKLLSQLSAQIANVIAMAKDGLKSIRNKFVSVNFTIAYYNNGEADIALEHIRLTDSTFALPGFIASRIAEGIQLQFKEAVNNMVDQIVWVILRRSNTGYVTAFVAKIQDVPGADRLFTTVIPSIDGDAAILCYGIRYNSLEAKTKYAELVVANQSNLATLLSTKNILQTSAGLTETRGLWMESEDENTETSGTYDVRIDVSIMNLETGEEDSECGTVTGAGVYPQGTRFTLRADAAEGYEFYGWKKDMQGEFIGGDIAPTQHGSLNVEALHTTRLYACFAPVMEYNVYALPGTANELEGQSISGAHMYTVGQEVTLTAPAAPQDYTFEWRNDQGTWIGDGTTYTFIMPDHPVTIYYVYRRA